MSHPINQIKHASRIRWTLNEIRQTMNKVTHCSPDQFPIWGTDIEYNIRNSQSLVFFNCQYFEQAIYMNQERTTILIEETFVTIHFPTVQSLAQEAKHIKIIQYLLTHFLILHKNTSFFSKFQD